MGAAILRFDAFPYRCSANLILNWAQSCCSVDPSVPLQTTFTQRSAGQWRFDALKIAQVVSLVVSYGPLRLQVAVVLDVVIIR